MRIGWILNGNRQVAGARIHGWNMHETLKKRGYDSDIIHAEGFSTRFQLTKSEIDSLDGYDAIFINRFKTGENLPYFLDTTRAKIIYICSAPPNPLLVERADRILVVSDYLLKKLPEDKSIYVFDGYEQDPSKRKTHHSQKRITLGYVSNNVYDEFPQIDRLPENVKLKIIGPPEKRVKKHMPGKTLFSKTKIPFEYKVWDEDTVTDELLETDVGVIPYPDDQLEEDAIKAKSNNRAIYLMSLGLPVIASPLHELKNLVKNDETGYIATTKEEWQEAIKKLRDDPDLRKRMGEKAREQALPYSKEAQADEYERILKEVVQKQ
ncbi:glycosyltransferase family 4 protein [Candidatus Woesearchaeota archaeon]|nr:glycosyltransferase family 4 protein [Candidatus Woesearchaeota archaeon]